MRPEFIVGYVYLWSRSGWICFDYSSLGLFWTTSSNIYSSSYSYLVCSLCASTGISVSLLLSTVLIWSYGSTKWIEFTLGLCHTNVDLGGRNIEVSIFLLNYLGIDPCLWFFLNSCSLADFSWLTIGLWKSLFTIYHHAA